MRIKTGKPLTERVTSEQLNTLLGPNSRSIPQLRFINYRSTTIMRLSQCKSYDWKFRLISEDPKI